MDNNFLNKVLITCCLCGGISKDAYMLFEGGKHSKESKMSLMRTEGWFSNRIKGVDTLWQPEKNIDVWCNRIPREYVEIGINTRNNIINHTNNNSQIRRVQRNSEAVAFILESGIDITPNLEFINNPTFIPASAAKINKKNGDSIAIRSARMAGFLMMEQKSWILYSTDGGTFTLINPGSELAIQKIIEASLGRTLSAKRNAVIISTDLDKLRLFIENKKLQKLGIQDSRGIYANERYEEFYVIPRNQTGSILMQLLDVDASLINKNILPAPTVDNVSIKAYWGTYDGDRLEYSLLKPDLKILVKIKAHIKAHPKDRYVIHCIDEYATGIRAALEECEADVTYKTYTIDDVLSGLN